MEHKSIPAQFKADDAAGTFEGYASVFGVTDSYGDVVQAGAYKKTLSERADRVKLLWNHDSAAPPIGRVLGLAEDSTGLAFRASFSATPRAQEVRQLILDGAIGEMSIGFSTIQSVSNDQGGRDLRELKLYEISAVNFPANESAVITGAKSLDDAPTFLHDLARELKAGRTLSAASLARIRTALDELTALLADAEPAKNAAPVTAAADRTLFDGLKGLRHRAQNAALLTELRAFGQSLGDRT